MNQIFDMKRTILFVLFLFLAVILLSFLNVDFYTNVTGKATSNTFISSVKPSGDINTRAFDVLVSTTINTNCSYALSLKNAIGYKYFQPMEMSGYLEHKQLLKDLKDGEYDINIKCSDENGMTQTSTSSIKIALPSNCVVYCQYKGKCDEVAEDSCGNLCKRDTTGVECGENKVCKDSVCLEKSEEKPFIKVIEEEPAVVQEAGLFDKLVLWLKELFS